MHTAFFLSGRIFWLITERAYPPVVIIIFINVNYIHKVNTVSENC